ncbi:hypothetical protein Q8A73_002397 [Channa argus]|nr:hypothetical protein Q8A73_002397 [Channa argus]
MACGWKKGGTSLLCPSGGFVKLRAPILSSPRAISRGPGAVCPRHPGVDSLENGLPRQAQIDLLKTQALCLEELGRHSCKQLEVQRLMGSTAQIQHRVTQHGLASAQLMERTKELIKELKEDHCSTRAHMIQRQKVVEALQIEVSRLKAELDEKGIEEKIQAITQRETSTNPKGSTAGSRDSVSDKASSFQTEHECFWSGPSETRAILCHPCLCGPASADGYSLLTLKAHLCTWLRNVRPCKGESKDMVQQRSDLTSLARVELLDGIEQHKRADINNAVGITEKPIVYTKLADAVNKKLKSDWDTRSSLTTRGGLISQAVYKRGEESQTLPACEFPAAMILDELGRFLMAQQGGAFSLYRHLQ